MEIYIAKNKTQMGPYDISQITQMLQSGILEKYDLFWHEGMLDWAPVASLIKNAAQSQKEEKTDPITATSTPIYQGSNQVQNTHMQGGSEPLATWSLVFGFLGLFCLGMLAGIPAIVCGHLALSNINRNPILQGRGSATAGLILGYLGTIFWIVFGIALYRR
jgi:hypothetical protein